VSELEAEHGEQQTASAEERKPPRQRRKRPPRQTSSTRLDRRAAQIEETLKELVGWFRLGWLDSERLPFLDTVERDAKRIGTGLAAVGERINPFGKLLDAVFGLTGPLAIIVALGPTIRAAYHDGRAKLRLRRARREAEAQTDTAVEPVADELVDLYEEAVAADRRADWEGDQAPAGLE